MSKVTLVAWLLGLGLAAIAGCSADTVGVAQDVPGDAEAVADVRPDTAPDTPGETATDTTDNDTLPHDDTGPDASDAPPSDVGPTPTFDPIASVDPFQGTGATGINFGARFPGPKLPFGMVALSPDTEGYLPATFGQAHAGGYFYPDTEVNGFSHLHLAGTGVADYGCLSVLPAVGDAAAISADLRSAHLPLDHEREVATPGYYRLETDHVVAELTATLRTGAHRYTFAPTPDALILVNLAHAMGSGEVTDSAVTVHPETGEVAGWLHNYGEFSRRFDGFRLYFVLQPDRPPATVGVWEADGYHPETTEASGPDAGVALSFDASAESQVVLRVGVSFVDLDGARANLEAEALGRSFDSLREAAVEAWREALAVVDVEGGTADRRSILYTSLYHMQMMPTLLTDVDGRYVGLDKATHVAEGFTYYSDLSLWDTYRTFHPLAILLYPTAQRDFVRSLLAMAEQQGSLPRWPLAVGDTGSMLGTSADIVIADTYDKGLRDFDVDAAYAAMLLTAHGTQPAGNAGRTGLQACLDHGYCPADMVGGSVSRTLEYAADDYCVARLAGQLGKTEDEAAFYARSETWRNLYDADRAFLAPRNADGTFPSYSATSGGDPWVEGNAWQYSFMVPFDAPGLVETFGGPEPFAAKLEAFMAGAREDFDPYLPSVHYWHGNEPNLVAPFLFGFAGRPELTRFWTHWVADYVYTAEPAGLAGNDDGGTLAAWYVFAAAGIYPLPCTGEYALGAPLFDRVVWHLPGGDLDIRLGDDPGGQVLVGDAVHSGPTISHDLLLSGARLELPPPYPDPEREQDRRQP